MVNPGGLPAVLGAEDPEDLVADADRGGTPQHLTAEAAACRSTVKPPR